MSELLAFTIVGVVTGSIYAVAASGLVVTYTTSGVFNIAHGAVGMLMAFVYWQVRYDWGWPTPVSLAFVLLVAAASVMYLRSRRAPVDHHNVNDEWQDARPAERVPAGTAG